MTSTVVIYKQKWNIRLKMFVMSSSESVHQQGKYFTTENYRYLSRLTISKIYKKFTNVKKAKK